jgi:hypothetical protein
MYRICLFFSPMLQEVEGGGVATVKIYDRAHEFRIEIAGRLGGDCVTEVETAWKSALLEPSPRRFTVDISRLNGFDNNGRRLLRDMYQHGTQFSAGTPLSLVFLNEISSPARRGGPALVQGPLPNRKEDKDKTHPLVRRMAAGH